MEKQVVLLHGILGFGEEKPFGMDLANYFHVF
jgi:hypothetical protein